MVVGLLAMCAVAISGRSLWIDEAATAVQAMQPDLGSWWQLLVQEKTAHLQMPFYMLYIWGYEKAFGSSEWALRLANAPWFIASFFAVKTCASSGRFWTWSGCGKQRGFM